MTTQPTTPEPEWLPRLRGDMRTEFADLPLLGIDIAATADRAAGLAASYLHPTYDKARALEDALKLKGEMLDEMRGRVRDRGAEIAGLKGSLKSAHEVAARYVRAMVLQEARITELEEENAGRLRELEAYDGGYKGERWGLPEVMPGHIAAFRKAYLGEARKYAEEPAPVELDECIRAGLAAVQWVPLAEPVQSSPGMREVPPTTAQVGDVLTCIRPVTEVVGGSAWFEDGTEVPLSGPGVTVTRPVSPLPDKPGAVGTATANGKKGCRVFRADSGAPQPWIVLDADGSGPYWVADHELSDFVSLDGSDL